MKRFMAGSLAAAMLITGMAQLAFAKSEKTELLAFDETIGVFDQTSGEAITETNIPSGSKVGIEGNLATWGMGSGNVSAEALSASVVSDEYGATGDAFKIHYTKKLSSDYGESLRFDSVSVDYDDIIETKPLVLEFRMKADWTNTVEYSGNMNVPCVDVVPIIKPESGNALENKPLTQQSILTADNGNWLTVKYVIKTVTADADKASIVFDRYVNAEKKLNDTKVDMASGTGTGARIIGMKIRPRARDASYNDDGYMNITFDYIKLYREETIIPPGTKWGDDLTINEEYNHDLIPNGTVIGDNNTAAEYKLANIDGTTEGYSAQITDDNSELVINNVSSLDGYKSQLTPVSPKKYTSEDIADNGALVYEARYKIKYNLTEGVSTSYSAVQMYFDFYHADNKTMQFAVPATTKASDEYITVKIIIPNKTFNKEGQPYVFADNAARTVNVTVDDLEYIQLRRVVFSNKIRSGQEIGEEQSAATLTLDYLDQYVIEEDNAFDITSDDLQEEMSEEAVGVNFTGTHYIDKSTVTKAVLKKKSADGSYEALENYGVRSTGDKTFYMGFSGSLIKGAEYEIDLSEVKDIYGNSLADKKLHFNTDKSQGSIQWLDCGVSDSTISYKIENGTGSDAEGFVYAAVHDKQTGVLKACERQSVTVTANGEFESTITITDIDSEDDIVLFFWDDNNMPYLDKNPVTAE